MQEAGCQNHPTRDAIGLCVQCRTRVCGECATKVDGINYCAGCLAGLAEAAGRSPGSRTTGPAGAPRPPSASGAPIVVLLQLTVLSLGLFSLLQLILPG
jgi:hypothetical protein